jgi:hypothetical protein
VEGEQRIDEVAGNTTGGGGVEGDNSSGSATAGGNESEEMIETGSES